MAEDTPYSYRLVKRIFDLIVACVTFLFVCPFVAFAFIRNLRSAGLLQRVALVGRDLVRFTSLTSSSATIRRAIRLVDVARGHASIVGPRLARIEELREDALHIRRVVPPGLVCLQWLRIRSNVAFVPEIASDLEYAEKRSLKLDLSIMVRALLVSLYGKPATHFTSTVQMLGVRIDNMTQGHALEYIENTIDGLVGPVQIAFVNADCLNKAVAHREYRRTLNSTSLVLADGIGVKIAGSLLSRPTRQNVNGTDLFPHLCQMLNRKAGKLFLLGARPEVVEALANRLRIEYPSLSLCGAADGYFADEDVQVKQIADAAPDVLLVAMGSPIQEQFISRNADRLGAKVSIGVGGLFDFYSGRIRRAPRWMRDSGLEWVYRLIQEPGRMWKRYLVGNFVFLAYTLAEKFGVSYGEPNREQVRVG